MIRLLLFHFALFLVRLVAAQPTNTPLVITDDVRHFWEAYDLITATEDTSAQRHYLEAYFLDRATPGLEAIMAVRQYTPEQYLEGIRRFPRFWASIRPNMERVDALVEDLTAGIEGLARLYPDLRPAKIYFTVGAFRTNGTTLDSMVLIGGELALADEHTVTEEFPERMRPLADFFATNPIDHIVFLNVHEYVHTQQVTALDANLLTQCLREGIAEYLAELATGHASSSPAISYGREHHEAVMAQFEREMFNRYYRYWLWSNLENQFGLRDLGYYVGYSLAEAYVQKQPDTAAAVRTLLTLNLLDSLAVAQVVDGTELLSNEVQVLRAAFEADRPRITTISIANEDGRSVDPRITRVEVSFSEPMDTRFRGFDLGPLGEENVLRVQNFDGFSEDGKTMTFTVAMEPGRRYQLVFTQAFVSARGVELAPYLLDFETAEP